MLIDEVKKANMDAMRAHDADKRAVLSIVVARYLEQKTNGSGKEVTDLDVLHIIQKVDKELDEEKASYLSANRAEQAAQIDKQKAVLVPFIPKQLSETEIRSLVCGPCRIRACRPS
jgi:uncharacterized protein YqeY